MDGEIRSRPSTPAYRDGWDRIFNSKKKCEYCNELKENVRYVTGHHDVFDGRYCEDCVPSGFIGEP